MYKETVFSRSDLHSAVDALDRLGKEYTIKKINAVEVDYEQVGFSMSKVKNPERFDRWVIEEVAKKVELVISKDEGFKATFYDAHGTIKVAEE
ncbi:hypothetical protein [Paenibacillus sp. BR1-192]|uniref:hypothetical protein n=1 Tax=Paenibacillus sp. BR1-192 TaxID=3032287 RepID=UPI00240E8455|nr:hypothetical protein [Paenibacillus sp. BR1-192]WFB57483.1 hypothetical protein P0X86_26495 [Paenibacillus sp. BR1-192]